MSPGVEFPAPTVECCKDIPAPTCLDDLQIRRYLQGMRCGDTSKNAELSARMRLAREAGQLPPLDWKPVSRRERCDNITSKRLKMIFFRSLDLSLMYHTVTSDYDIPMVS